MRAVVREAYGSPDRLELREVERPTPGDGEVLIAVEAVALNASDVESLRGSPAYTRIWGLRKPKYPILGSDIAGVVEAVGNGVTRFETGDAVFGDVMGCWGGLAEFACAPAKMLIGKPDDLSFVDAAALPQAGLVALQGIRGRMQSGPKVLINGAGGGAGSFAIQIAKHLGAEVTGVDHTNKLDFMRSLGADRVVDYTREDFTASGERYDLILDLVAAHSIFEYRRALTPRGRYLMVGGSMRHLFQTLFLGSALSLGRRRLTVLAAKQNEGLGDLVDMVRAGTVKPVIDRQFELDETIDAFRRLAGGEAAGKLVVTP